jgi:prepilin-type N-terminal cleavage/methylation domain-containing protein
MANSFAATLRGGGHLTPCERLRQRSPHSRGFTLLEMLIVLAILAAVAAWTWPSMRRQMIDSELRDAGKQVRDQLARARHRAVDTGTLQQFRFQPGQRGFEVTVLPLATLDCNTASTLTVDASAVGGALGTTRDDPQQPQADRHELPEGAFFLSAAAAANDTSIAAFDSGTDPSDSAVDDKSTLPVESTDLATSQADDIWSQPIVFYPNGRTTDATIRLANRTGAHLDVTLRGLTGVAKAGRLQRRRVRQ